jgi:hypothetical protein
VLDKLFDLWDHLRRWRTWILNVAVALALGLGQLAAAFDGFDWSAILPSPWDKIAIVAIVLLNVWMRPRAAVLPREARGEERRRRVMRRA